MSIAATVAAACAAFDKPGWSGEIWADAKLAIEELRAATRRLDEAATRLDATSARLEAALQALPASQAAPEPPRCSCPSAAG